ncbi:hypothetical protein HUJ04_011859 [Dendroctonus ponderosae]|nr:hypothetical protein HUJ04_011859 [Dendroctonus ponderosae]KAH1028977.1 hypothetical protein HUJ05_002288 [Dendroctonus ponderosae]
MKNLLNASLFQDILNIAIALPVFSAFVRSVGGSPFTLGLINSSGALVSLLWNPIVGSLSDQVGRKGLLLKCLIASSVGSVILAASTSVWLVFVGKLVGSLGSPVGILLRSIVADTYRTSEEKKAFFGKNGFFISVGFLVGSVSSGFLSEAKNGFAMSFLMMAAVTGISAAIAFQTVSDDTKTQDKFADVSFSSKAVSKLRSAVVNMKTISWSRYQSLFCIKGFYDLSIAIIFTSVGLTLINEFQVKGRTIGYVFVISSLCRIASGLLKIRLKSALANTSDYSRITGVGVILLVSYVAMGVSGSLSVFVLFMGIMSFCRASMDTTLTEMIATRTTSEDRGKVIGAFENLNSISMFIAPILTGALAELLGLRFIIGSAAIPISAASLIAYKAIGKTE